MRTAITPDSLLGRLINWIVFNNAILLVAKILAIPAIPYLFMINARVNCICYGDCLANRKDLSADKVVA